MRQSYLIGRGARRHSHVTRGIACGSSVDTESRTFFTSACVMIITPNIAPTPISTAPSRQMISSRIAPRAWREPFQTSGPGSLSRTGSLRDSLRNLWNTRLSTLGSWVAPENGRLGVPRRSIGCTVRSLPSGIDQKGDLISQFGHVFGFHANLAQLLASDKAHLSCCLSNHDKSVTVFFYNSSYMYA